MIDRLRLQGTTGKIAFGYLDAAVLRSWRIVYHARRDGGTGQWKLAATFARVDKALLRKRPLLFTAARDGLVGFWCWSIDTPSIQIGDTQIVATLGPPEG